MKTYKLLLPVLFASVVYSCGNNSRGPKNFAMEMADQVYDQVAPPPASAPGIDRKIIREGNLTFETRDIDATRSMIEKNTKECNGYIAQENAWSSDDRIQHTLELRVPEDKLDLLISRITENVEKIDSRSINSQDVTEEFIDNEARLRTKKELESRYLELLKAAGGTSCGSS